MFENGVLSKILVLNGTRDWGSGEDYIKRSFIICTPNQILFG